MILYLLRHGEAEARSHTDASRQLTAKGKFDVKQVAKQFATRDIRLDRCFASPYDRASQTAALFLHHAGQTAAIETVEVLTPEIRASKVMEFLKGVQGQHVLLVSHNPLLSELHALLTDGNITSMQILGTSELVCVALDVIGLGMGTTPFRLVPEGLLYHA